MLPQQSRLLATAGWALATALALTSVAQAEQGAQTAQSVAYFEASVVNGLFNAAKHLYDAHLVLALNLLPESASVAPRAGKAYDYKFANEAMVRPRASQPADGAADAEPADKATIVDLSAWAAGLRLPDDPPAPAGKTGLAAARLYKAVHFAETRTVTQLAETEMAQTWGAFNRNQAWEAFRTYWFVPTGSPSPYVSLGASDVLAMAVEYYRVLRFLASEGVRYSLKFEKNRPQGKWTDRADLVGWTLHVKPFYVETGNAIGPATDANRDRAKRWFCRFSLEGEAALPLRFSNVQSASDKLQVSASIIGDGDRWVPDRLDFLPASVVLTKEQTEGVPADVQVPAPAGTLALLLSLTGFDPKISHTVAEHIFGGAANTRYLTGTVFDFPTKRSGKVGSRQVYGVGQEIASGSDGGVALGVAAGDGTSLMPCAQFRASAFSVMVGPWIGKQGNSFKVHPAVGVGFDLAALLGRNDAPKPLVIRSSPAGRSWGQSGLDLTKDFTVRGIQWKKGTTPEKGQGQVRLIQTTDGAGKPLTDSRRRATLTFKPGAKNSRNPLNPTTWVLPRGRYRLIAPAGMAVHEVSPIGELDWTSNNSNLTVSIDLKPATSAPPVKPVEYVWRALATVEGTGLPADWQTVGRAPVVCVAVPVDTKRVDNGDVYLRVDGAEPTGAQTDPLDVTKGITIAATVQGLGDVRTWLELDYLDDEADKGLRSMTAIFAGAKEWTTHTLRVVVPSPKQPRQVCLRFMAAGKGEVRFTALTVDPPKP